MTQKNSLMEWLEQTRRINKNVDIICCQTIDGIINIALPYLNRKFLLRNGEFFDRFCKYYHKDNPIDLFKAQRKKQVDQKPCKVLIEFVQGSVDRCWRGIEMVKIQWGEVIDLLWERPELVNPSLIDEYIRMKIAEVCAEFNKRNPLVNGMWEHFGKHWRDANGQWQEERRKRS